MLLKPFMREGLFPLPVTFISTVSPLLMTGSRTGMSYCTLKSLDRKDPFAAMFPDGKDPVEALHE